MLEIDNKNLSKYVVEMLVGTGILSTRGYFWCYCLQSLEERGNRLLKSFCVLYWSITKFYF